MKFTTTTVLKPVILSGFLAAVVTSPSWGQPGGLGPGHYTCTMQKDGDATGCVSNVTAGQAAQCVWYAPNWGITWRATWKCHYEIGRPDELQGSSDYHCGWYVTGVGYCCNDIDTTPGCPNPAGACPRDYPGGTPCSKDA